MCGGYLRVNTFKYFNEAEITAPISRGFFDFARRCVLHLQVKLELRRNVLGTYAAAESVGIFKSIMWRERRPRLLRVFADECAELDRRVMHRDVDVVADDQR